MGIQYTRPSLTPQQLDQAYQAAHAMRHRKTSELINAIVMFSVENARLWVEVNDHRVKLGIPPLPWEIDKRG
jgi:hypothetical protein